MCIIDALFISIYSVCIGLSNPIGDLTITPMVAGIHTTSLNISWTPPILRGGMPSLVYSIDVYYLVSIFEERHYPYRHTGGSNSYIFDITNKQPRVYYVNVMIDRLESGLHAKQVCIDTALPCKCAL